MAFIGVRSPYFLSGSGAGIAYALLDLTINGTLVYSITKDAVYGTTTVSFDISELIRDYIQPQYDGSVVASDSGYANIIWRIRFYDSSNVLVSDTGNQTEVALDGYNYYSSGNNFSFTGAQDLVSSSTIFVPENTAGFIFQVDGTNSLVVTSYSTSASSVGSTTISRLPCSRFINTKLIFLNRFGVLEEVYFNAKQIPSEVFNGSRYKSNYISASGGVDSNRHQYVDYNKNGKIQYTLNTDYVNENINYTIQQLMASEYVWIAYSGSIAPINITSSNVTYKNSLNDRLVRYTITVENAYDSISTVR